MDTQQTRWGGPGLPFEHAVDDGEEEDKVKDAFPVGHHYSIGSAQMRLTLRRNQHHMVIFNSDV